MTDHPTHETPELSELDGRAAAAAAGLRAHVEAHLDAHGAPTLLPATARPRPRNRWMAVAAAVALLAGTVAVLSQQAGDAGVRVDLDEEGEALPDFEPGVLRPLGPRDGKDSIQLPVTAEPNTGLHDGDTVSVSSPGFEPGERVGIVLCAREAGGETPESRGGVDGCNVGTVQYADADAQGTAAGSITVRRVLTTPLTGTVDCAAEANRCMVAMGALNDYDRSGGHGIELAPAAPIELPTMTVTPTEGLADGDVVHVVADGLTPDTVTELTVCSSDPAACWQTGHEIEVEHDDGGETSTGLVSGLRADGTGHLQGDVPVWRFLPGGEPGTYIDCAASQCSLRLTGDTAPPTVPLHFNPDGDGPVAPALSVEPDTGLATGDEVIVRGKGFTPGEHANVMLCAHPTGAPDSYESCASSDGEPPTVDADGSFALVFRIPEMGSMGGYATEECSPDGACRPVQVEEVEVRCDDAGTSCFITADPYSERPMATRPVFRAVPIPVTFR